MKNKNRIFRVSALLLVLCFISTVMISGTFAKYTSTYSGQDTALVAKWSLDVKGGQNGENELGAFTTDGSETSAATLDLFSHAFDDGIVTSPGKIIAPGVDGSFVLSVTNKSDVAAGVTFDFAVSGDASGVPMEYSLNPFPEESSLEEPEDYVDYGGLGNKITAFQGLAAASDTATTQTVYWRWPYEVVVGDDLVASDEADTALGKASATAAEVEGGSRTNYILTITATATQIEPE